MNYTESSWSEYRFNTLSPGSSSTATVAALACSSGGRTTEKEVAEQVQGHRDRSFPYRGS